MGSLALGAATLLNTVGKPSRYPQRSTRNGKTERLLFLGDDMNGIPLEVMGIRLEHQSLLVIHAMKLRPRYRDLYHAAIPYRQA